MPPAVLPRLTAAFGLHGSASTWVFNVARELLTARLGAKSIAIGYGETARSLFQPGDLEGRHILMKCHRIAPDLSLVLWLARAPVLISIRDPRDAALSMMQRFGRSFEEAVAQMEKDVRHVLRQAAAGHPVFRYEDGFTGKPETVAEIGRHLGIAAAAKECRDLVARYDAAAVRAFGDRVPDLPEARLIRIGEDLFDRVTHIHPNHVGDGRIGKWRELLDGAQQATAERRFRPFLERFGYR
ncbi:hypothetical protein [Stella sp.]|uniref:hypothetical protein n=1 Tax=Stella sp. TaxID=2912054 RepID=UPI0035B412FB